MAIAAPLVVGLTLRRTVRAMSCLLFPASRDFLLQRLVTRQEDARIAKGDALTSFAPPRKTDAEAVLTIARTATRKRLALLDVENIFLLFGNRFVKIVWYYYSLSDLEMLP